MTTDEPRVVTSDFSETTTGWRVEYGTGALKMRSPARKIPIESSNDYSVVALERYRRLPCQTNNLGFKDFSLKNLDPDVFTSAMFEVVKDRLLYLSFDSCEHIITYDVTRRSLFQDEDRSILKKRLHFHVTDIVPDRWLF